MTTFWVYRLIPAWAPPWLVELASGLSCAAAALVVLLLPRWLALAVLATALSLIYEAKYDPNGFELWDIAQREIGIILGAIITRVLFP